MKESKKLICFKLTCCFKLIQDINRKQAIFSKLFCDLLGDPFLITPYWWKNETYLFQLSYTVSHLFTNCFGIQW